MSDTDQSPRYSTLSPHSSLRGRPMGPRTRQSSANMAAPYVFQAISRDRNSLPSRMPSTSGERQTRSFTDDPDPSSPTSLNESSPSIERNPLPVIGEQPSLEGATTHATNSRPNSPFAARSRPVSTSSASKVVVNDAREASPFRSNTPTPSSSSPSPAPSRVASLSSPIKVVVRHTDEGSLHIHNPPTPPPTAPSPAPSQVSNISTTKIINQPVSLPPPPKISFDSTPIKWKGLPLEAALWTLDSSELQKIVSRAIRSSAQESFIRLVSIDNLDRVFPAELERLNDLKLVTQSKYRFNVHRRTMLLQALVSYSGTSGDKEKDGGASLIGSLAKQLSEITASCDVLAEELVSVTDQIRQIHKLLDIHWASALAIALRKLNGSYGKRTTELLGARDRIDHLEAELDDAWKEAERLAQEMDDMTIDGLGFDPDEETGVIETAEIVALPSPPATMTTIPGKLQRTSPSSPSAVPAPLSPIFRPAVQLHDPPRPIQTTLRSLTPPPRITESVKEKLDESKDTDRISLHSNKSIKSTRTQEPRRVEMVTAARRRSLRTSMGSLRLPRRVSTRAGNRTPIEPDQPPVPEIPASFSSPVSAHPSNSINHETSIPPSSQIPNEAIPRRTTLDDIEIVSRHPAELQRLGTADDMYIMPLRDNELEGIGRKKLARRSADNITLVGAGIMGAPYTGQSSIPSVWMNADAPRTPAERVELMNETRVSEKGSSYGKLKSLTKRYSLPLNAMLARTLTTRSSGSR